MARSQVKLGWLSVLAACVSVLAASVCPGQTTGSSLFGSSQGFGSSLSPTSGTRLSGSSRTTGSTSGLSSSSSLSGQFMNIQSVNTADQLFGSSNTFVGADSSDASNPLSMMGTGSSASRSTGLTSRSSLGTGLQSLSSRSLLGSRNSRTGSQYSTFSRYGGRTQQDPIRSAVRVGFTPPTVQPQQVAQELTARLSQIPALRNSANGANVQVSLDGNVAVLKGTVPTNHDRLVLERLLLLEPGVDKVQNELVVAETNRSPSAQE